MKQAILLGLMLALSACAPTLSGHLKSDSGEFMAHPEGRINISSLESSAAEKSVTVLNIAEDGSFKTNEPLAPGAYLIEALVPGYKLASTRFSLGELREVNLTLTPIPQVKTLTIGVSTGRDVGRAAGGATLTPPKL